MKVRIQKKIRITFYGDRPDEQKDCRMKQFGRDGFRMEIYIAENNLRFSKLVLGHKQLRSLGIGYSKSADLIYLFEEIDNNFRCSGRLFAVPWLDLVVTRLNPKKFIRKHDQSRWIKRPF